jgi:hypothetical protein
MPLRQLNNSYRNPDSYWTDAVTRLQAPMLQLTRRGAHPSCHTSSNAVHRPLVPLARVRRCFGPHRARPVKGLTKNASTGRDETGRGQTKASPVCGPGVPRSANGDEGLCVIHGFVRMLDVRYRRQLKHGRMLTFTQPRE